LQQERAAIVPQIKPSTYQLYERARKARKGVGVAEAVEGRCSACHMAMRPQFSQDLKRGDQIMVCESCQRILYYVPPQAFEDLTGEPAPAVSE